MKITGITPAPSGLLLPPSPPWKMETRNEKTTVIICTTSWTEICSHIRKELFNPCYRRESQCHNPALRPCDSLSERRATLQQNGVALPPVLIKKRFCTCVSKICTARKRPVIKPRIDLCITCVFKNTEIMNYVSYQPESCDGAPNPTMDCTTPWDLSPRPMETARRHPPTLVDGLTNLYDHFCTFIRIRPNKHFKYKAKIDFLPINETLGITLAQRTGRTELWQRKPRGDHRWRLNGDEIYRKFTPAMPKGGKSGAKLSRSAMGVWMFSAACDAVLCPGQPP